jgi:hypothetical protein
MEEVVHLTAPTASRESCCVRYRSRWVASLRIPEQHGERGEAKSATSAAIVAAAATTTAAAITGLFQ